MKMKIGLLTFTLLIMSIAQSLAQQGEARYTTYLDELFRECKKKDAAFVRNLFAINDSLLKAEVHTLDGVKKMDGTFIHRQTKIVEHGLFVFYFPNGNIESEGIYENGYKSGAWKRFEANGSQKPDRYYKPESGDLLRALEK